MAKKLELQSRVNSITSYKDYLVIGNYEGEICIYSLANFSHVKNIKAHKATIKTVIATDDMLITAAKEKKVKFWINFNEEYQVEHKYRVTCCAMTNAKTLLFTADINGVIMCTNIHTRYSVKYTHFKELIVGMAALEDSLVVVFNNHFILIRYVDYIDLDFYKYIRSHKKQSAKSNAEYSSRFNNVLVLPQFLNCLFFMSYFQSTGALTQSIEDGCKLFKTFGDISPLNISIARKDYHQTSIIV